jgi:hypothetical protein
MNEGSERHEHYEHHGREYRNHALNEVVSAMKETLS